MYKEIYIKSGELINKAGCVSLITDDMGKQSLLINFGRKYNGYACITIKFVAGRFCAKKLPEEGLMYYYGPKEDFVVARSMLKASYMDDVYTFKATVLVCLQYLKLDIPADWGVHGTDWTVENAGIELHMREVTHIGSFECSDELLNKIWSVGANTIHLCMFPHKHAYAYRSYQPEEVVKAIGEWHGFETDFVLVDGPRRDREVWVGDLLPEVRTCWYAFKDAEVIKNSIKIFADKQKENGFIPASSVSQQTFSEYCCWFVVVLHEYIMFSGDYEFLEQMKPNLYKVMEWIKGSLDEKEMLKLDKRQTWAWTLAREGYVTSTQCVLHEAYCCAAKMAKWLGCSEKENQYQEAASKLKKNIQKDAWSESIRIFKDAADDSKEVSASLDANAYSILFNVADNKQMVDILDYVKKNMWTEFGSMLLYPPEQDNGFNWPHNTHIWPFAVSFEAEARFKSKDTATAIELLKRCWGAMIDKGTDTFWEVIDRDNGDFLKRKLFESEDSLDAWNGCCHGWSAGVTHLLQAYIAGIRPLEPGFKTFTVDPQLSGLDIVSVEVPVPCGVIRADYKKADEKGQSIYKCTLDIPVNTSAVLNTSLGEFILNEGMGTAAGINEILLNSGHYEFDYIYK